jgi:RNA polymerase sigma-70 factor (ECF subfamily)
MTVLQGALPIDRRSVSEMSPVQTLDGFLAAVERRALRMAEIATRNRDEALDIVQDAMFQLARSYAGQPAAEWPPLFYRILQNKIRDWQRRRKVTSRLFFWRGKPDGDDEDPLDLLPDPALSVPDQFAQGQAMQRLEQALRELPARQRQAFELRIWEGLSVDQTAQAMACSDGSVKTHLSRALSRLRADLSEVYGRE